MQLVFFSTSLHRSSFICMCFIRRLHSFLRKHWEYLKFTFVGFICTIILLKFKLIFQNQSDSTKAFSFLTVVGNYVSFKQNIICKWLKVYSQQHDRKLIDTYVQRHFLLYSKPTLWDTLLVLWIQLMYILFATIYDKKRNTLFDFFCHKFVKGRIYLAAFKSGFIRGIKYTEVLMEE